MRRVTVHTFIGVPLIRLTNMPQLDAWGNCKLFVTLNVFNSLTSFDGNTQCGRSKYPSAGLTEMLRALWSQRLLSRLRSQNVHSSMSEDIL